MRNGRTVFVTGGTGMVGAALVSRLVEQGDEVTLLVRETSSWSRLEAVKSRVTALVGDLRDAAAVRRAVQAAEPEVVYHLASTSFNPPTTTAQAHLETIVMGTLHLLEAIRDRRGTRLVWTGSAAQYGSGSRVREDHPQAPQTLLGAAKASASLLLRTYARLHGMETVELRLFMPYGPGEPPHRIIPHAILSALAGRDIVMTEGHQGRDLVYLDDVVDALLLAAAKPVAPGSIFNIGSGTGIEVRAVVEMILELMGCPVAALFGALPTRPDEIMEMSADVTQARRALGWEPRIALEEGLRRTIAWVTRHRSVIEEMAEPTASGQVSEPAGARS